MIGICGIKSMEKLENLPYFNKHSSKELIGKTGRNLDAKILQLTKKGYFVPLKNGVYTSSVFYNLQDNKGGYLEFLSNVLRYPSYISLEYVLYLNGAIPDAVQSITAVSIKTPRVYKNKLGIFIYRNIKEDLFTGFTINKTGTFNIKTATKSKALFDYLYLKRDISQNLKYEIEEGMRINWDIFSKKDLIEFYTYCKIANSNKMNKIYKIMQSIII